MRSRNIRQVGMVLGLLGVFSIAGCKKKPAPPPPAPPPAPMTTAAPAPTATLSVNPTSIERGQSATLSWSTTNADTVTIEGIGAVQPTGSQSVRPNQSTTYRLAARGSGGATDA